MENITGFPDPFGSALSGDSSESPLSPNMGLEALQPAEPETTYQEDVINENVAGLASLYDKTPEGRLDVAAQRLEEKKQRLGLVADLDQYDPESDAAGIQEEALRQKFEAQTGLDFLTARKMDMATVVETLNAKTLDDAQLAQLPMEQVEVESPEGQAELTFRKKYGNLSDYAKQVERDKAAFNWADYGIKEFDTDTLLGYAASTAAGAAMTVSGIADSLVRGGRDVAANLGLTEVADTLTDISRYTNRGKTFYETLHNSKPQEKLVNDLMQDIEQGADISDVIGKVASTLADNPSTVLDTLVQSAPYMIGMATKAGMATLVSTSTGDNYQENLSGFVTEHGRLPTDEEDAYLAGGSLVASMVDLAGDKLLGEMFVKGLGKSSPKLLDTLMAPKQGLRSLGAIGADTAVSAGGEFIAEGGSQLVNRKSQLQDKDLQTEDYRMAGAVGALGAAGGGMLTGAVNTPKVAKATAEATKTGIGATVEAATAGAEKVKGKVTAAAIRKKEQIKDFAKAEAKSVAEEMASVVEGKDKIDLKKVKDDIAKGATTAFEVVKDVLKKKQKNEDILGAVEKHIDDLDTKIKETSDPETVTELMEEREAVQKEKEAYVKQADSNEGVLSSLSTEVVKAVKTAGSNVKEAIAKLKPEEQEQALELKKLDERKQNRDPSKALNTIKEKLSGINIAEGFKVQAKKASDAVSKIAKKESSSAQSQKLENILTFATELTNKVKAEGNTEVLKTALDTLGKIKNEVSRFENKAEAQDFIEGEFSVVEEQLALMAPKEANIAPEKVFEQKYLANEMAIAADLFLTHYSKQDIAVNDETATTEEPTTNNQETSSKPVQGELDLGTPQAAKTEETPEETEVETVEEITAEQGELDFNPPFTDVDNLPPVSAEREKVVNSSFELFNSITSESPLENQASVAVSILTALKGKITDLQDVHTGIPLIPRDGKIDPENTQQLAAAYAYINRAMDALYRDTRTAEGRKQLEEYMDAINLAENLKKYPLEYSLITQASGSTSAPSNPTEGIPKETTTVTDPNFGSFTYTYHEGTKNGRGPKNGADYHVVKSDGTDEILTNEYLAKKLIFTGETDSDTKNLHTVYDAARRMFEDINNAYKDVNPQEGKRGKINVKGVADISTNPLRAYLQRSSKAESPSISSQILMPALIGGLQQAKILSMHNDLDTQKKLLGVTNTNFENNSILQSWRESRPYSKGTSIKKFARDIGNTGAKLPLSGSEEAGTKQALSQAIGALVIQTLNNNDYIAIEHVSMKDYIEDLAQLNTTLDDASSPDSRINFIINTMVESEVDSVLQVTESLNSAADKFKEQYQAAKVTYSPHKAVQGYVESLSGVIGTTKEKLKEVAQLLAQPFKFNKQLTARMMTSEGYIEYLKMNLSGLNIDGLETLTKPSDFDLTKENSKLNKLIEASVPYIIQMDIKDQAQGKVQEIKLFKQALIEAQEDYQRLNNQEFDPEDLSFLDADIYIPYKIPRNDRIHIAAKGMDVQNSKFVRLLLKPKSDTRSKVTSDRIKNKQHRNEYGYGLATVFGLDEKKIAKVGKKALTTINSFLYGKVLPEDKVILDQLANTELGLDQVKSLISGLSFMNKGDAIFDPKGIPDGINLMALAEELSNFNILKETGKSYTSNIAVEVDGITSGFAIGLFQTPFVDRKVLGTYLNRVGIYLKDSADKSYQAFRKKSTNKDSYENLLESSLNKLVVMFESEDAFATFDMPKDENGRLLNQPTKKQAQLIKQRKALYKSVGSVESYSKNVLESVVKNLRDLAKPPLMTFNYSASLPSIENFVKQDMMAKLRNKVAQLMRLEEGSDAYNQLIEELRNIAGTTDILTFTGVPNKEGKITTSRKVVINKTSKAVLTHKDLRELYLTENQERKIIDTVFGVYSAAMTNALAEEMGEVDAARSRMSGLVHSMMQNYMQILDTEIKKASTEKGFLTQNELNQIVRDLAYLLPSVEGFTGEKGRTENLVQLFNIEVTSSKKGADTQHTVSVEMPNNVNGTQSLTLGVLGKDFTPIKKGTTAILTQMLDSAVMSRKIGEVLDALHVHDAIKSGPFGASQTGQVLNEAFIEVMAQYNMYGDIAKSYTTKLRQGIEQMQKSGPIYTDRAQKHQLFTEKELADGIKQEHVYRLAGFNGFKEYLNNPKYSSFIGLLTGDIQEKIQNRHTQIQDIAKLIAEETDKKQIDKYIQMQEKLINSLSMSDLEAMGIAIFEVMNTDLDTIQDTRDHIFDQLEISDQYTGGVPNTAVYVKDLKAISRPEIPLLDSIQNAASDVVKAYRARRDLRIFAKEDAKQRILTASDKLAAEINEAVIQGVNAKTEEEVTLAVQTVKDAFAYFGEAGTTLTEVLNRLLLTEVEGNKKSFIEMIITNQDTKLNQPTSIKLQEAIKDALTKGAYKFKEVFTAKSIMQSYNMIAQNDTGNVTKQHDEHLRNYMANIIAALMGDKEITIAETLVPSDTTVGMTINGKSVVINQANTVTPADMSTREALVHETTHAVLDPIVNADPEFNAAIAHLRKEFLSQNSTEQIKAVLVGGTLTPELQALADSRYNHIFGTSPESLTEFVAYIATNEGMRSLGASTTHTPRASTFFGSGDTWYSALLNTIATAIKNFFSRSEKSVTDEFDRVIGVLAGKHSNYGIQAFDSTSKLVDKIFDPVRKTVDEANETISSGFTSLENKMKEFALGRQLTALTPEEKKKLIEAAKYLYEKTVEKRANIDPSAPLSERPQAKLGANLVAKRELDKYIAELQAELDAGYDRQAGAVKKILTKMKEHSKTAARDALIAKTASVVESEVVSFINNVTNVRKENLSINNLFRQFKFKTEKNPTSAEQSTRKQLIDSLNGKRLTKTQRANITRLALFTDLQSLLDTYTAEQIRELILNEKGRADRLNELKGAIELTVNNKNVAKGILVQADGLAQYMQDESKGVTKQLRNAKAIVTMNPYGDALPNREASIKGNEEFLIKLVDEYITLKSINEMANNSVLNFEDATATMQEFEGFFDELLSVNRANYNTAKEKIFSTNPDEDLLMIKGHTVESYPTQVETVTASLNKKNYYEKRGYETITIDEENGVAVYIRRGAYGGSSYMMGIGTGLANKAKGNSLLNVLGVINPSILAKPENAKKAIDTYDDIESLKAFNEQILGIKKQKKDKSIRLVPVIGLNGNITSYNYISGADFKDNFLRRDLDAIELSAIARGATERKIARREILDNSDGLIKALDDDYKANFAENRDQFVMLTGNEYLSNGEINPYRDLYNQLDPKLHYIVNNPNKDSKLPIWPDGIPVRKRDLTLIAGQKKIALADKIADQYESLRKTPVKATPKGERFRDKLSVGESTAMAHLLELWPETTVRDWLRFTEQIIKEVAVITKLNIVVKTPDVFLGNITSNMVSLSLVGMKSSDAMKKTLDGFKYITKYEKLHQKQLILENKLNALEPNTDEYRALQKQVRDIQAVIEALPIYPLIKAGMYTVIAEDINETDDSGILNKVGNLARDAAKDSAVLDTSIKAFDWIYLTKGNPIFDFISSATNAADFAARYAMYSHLKDMTTVGSKRYNAKTAARLNTEDKINEVLLNAFVYYDTPDGPILEYANSIGLFMFTKYWMRIQKLLAYLLKNNMIDVSRIAGLQLLLGKVDNVMLQNIFTKDLSYSVHNPLDHFESALDPQGIKIARDIISAF